MIIIIITKNYQYEEKGLLIYYVLSHYDKGV